MYVVNDNGRSGDETVVVMDVPRYRAKKLVQEWEELDEEIRLHEFLIYEDYADVNPDLIHEEVVRPASQNN